MKAATLVAPGKFQITEMERPTPGAGEVLVRVRNVGVCVKGLQPGDGVALELFNVCLTCDKCRIGEYQHCPTRKASGLNSAGGLREYMTLPAYTMYKLPPGVDFELGALVEPLTVNVH